MGKSIVFIDTEVGVDDHKIHDMGAIRLDGSCFHSASIRDFAAFVEGADYLCGHNILHHDLKYIGKSLGLSQGQPGQPGQGLRAPAIDTLYLSPLLFPGRPCHALLKEDKLQVDQVNDPVNDCRKAARRKYRSFSLISISKERGDKATGQEEAFSV